MATHLSGPIAGSGRPADGLEGAAYWHRLNGVFWAAFLLFSITTASIISGAIIERARSGAFWIIAVLIGSVTWILDASWGWHPARLDGEAAWLSRCLCVGRRACHRRRRRTGVPHRAWTAHWQIPRRRNAARYPAAQSLAGDDRAVPDLHGLLGLLRGLQHSDDFVRRRSPGRSPAKPGRRPTSIWRQPRFRRSPSTS